ncbi:hypothetical protein [Flavobacterium sp. N2270]|uniref:hypothetical protein n=1 Tax=Flavobacterium sp. N2270 TaxID=2986831 RepID=UPI002225B515|nr:hypothetical protein [Flavobacterium sp. N2270]
MKLNNLKNKIDNIAIVSIIVFIIFMLFSDEIDNLEIRNNKGITSGKILRKYYTTSGGVLEYEYTVNKIKYTGSVGVKKFIGHNNTNGCIGCEFYIYYSTKNPKKSKINLGKYNKYNRSLQLIKVE